MMVVRGWIALSTYRASQIILMLRVAAGIDQVFFVESPTAHITFGARQQNLRPQGIDPRQWS